MSESRTAIQLLDPGSGKQTGEIPTQDKMVRMAFSVDGKSLLTTERDCGIRSYSTESQELLWELALEPDPQGAESYASATACSSDGELIAAGAPIGPKYWIYLLEAKTGKQVFVLKSDMWKPWAVDPQGSMSQGFLGSQRVECLEPGDTLATQFDDHVAESMGVRSTWGPVRLSPIPRPQDIGRRPSAGFGKVAIDQVVPDSQQPRVEFSTDAIERLAASIRDQGQLSPIRVRWSAELGKWLIIAGERRWRATKHAGLSTIECYFHEQELSRSQVLEQQLIENLLREDLKPVEEARAFTELMTINGWNGKQVAESLRVPASKVSRSLALLRLPAEVQAQVDHGQISARTGYELSRLPSDSLQAPLIADATAGKVTHTQAAELVRKSRQRKPSRRNKAKSGIKLSFDTGDSWQVTVYSLQNGSYHHVEQALQRALSEVRHRIENNVVLY